MADSARRQTSAGRIGGKLRRVAPLALAIGGVLSSHGAWAGQWSVTPRLRLGQVFTDNATLAPRGQEQWDLFSQINPGLSVHGSGARVAADIDYQMQNFVSVRNRDRDSSWNRLKAKGTAELARQWLYLDATGGITQQAISPQERVALSNFYSAGNTANVYTYSLSPYLRHNFGGYVSALLRYTYGEATYSGQAAASTQLQRINASLGSGIRFGRMSWGLSYFKEKQKRQSASNLELENAAANVRYPLTSTLNLLAQGGYENNHYVTTRTAVVNGTYWGVGLGWTPNRHFSASALKGSQFETASVRIAPTSRTSLKATYRKREVGLNPGRVWSGAFGLNTRRTSWTARYSEDTTTVQQLALQQGYLVFHAIDPQTGQPIVDVTGTPVFVLQPIQFLGLTNDVLVRKVASGAVGFKTARTGIRFGVFDERREYQSSGENQRTQGINGSWSWRFATRTTSLLMTGWQKTDSSTFGDSRLWYAQETISRRIAPRLTGDVSYRHTSQYGRVRGGGYDANQISFVLSMYF